jgi:TPP-dependent pyruvate/acetoin dehydrogenase alpha subunit
VRQARKLIGKGFATESEIQRWQQEVRQEMLQAVSDAKAAPWPQPAALFENVY